MKYTLILILVICIISSAFEILLPGNKRLSYNGETGVLRFGSKPNRRVPIEGTSVDPHILASIEVRHTGNNLKGYGAYAIADIDEDVFLGFYEGTKIESREALDAVIRERRKKSGPNCDSASDYIMNVDGGVTFIDGFERAQDKSVFSTVHLNHADQESLNCNVIRLLEDDRIAFFTSRFIHAGEELCFDYGSNFWRGKEQNKI